MSNNAWTYGRSDAALNPAAFALNNGDGSTNSTSIDLGSPTSGGLNARLEPFEIEIQAPALGTVALPNADTVTYDLQESTDNTTFTDVMSAVGVQTGAGGAGAAAAKYKVRVPTDCSRYIRVQATQAGGSGDCSGSNVTVLPRF